MDLLDKKLINSLDNVFKKLNIINLLKVLYLLFCYKYICIFLTKLTFFSLKDFY